MLSITVPGLELYDEATSEFTSVAPIDLELEHSLLSLSKWESIFEKPFLGREPKTSAENRAYFRLMILTPGITDDVLDRLTQANLDEIVVYLESKQTATTFHIQEEVKTRSETITAELIYYWMVSFTIPFECETWHLNRLFALIRVCSIKNSKPTKKSTASAAADRQRLNAARRAQLGTSG